MGRLCDTGAADDVTARSRDEVAQYGGCGLHSPGPGPIEHEVTCRRGLDEDSIVGSVHGGERMGPTDQRRVHTC